MILRRRGSTRKKGEVDNEENCRGDFVDIFLRTVVRIGSRLQCELGDWKSQSKISDMLAGIK